MLIVEDNVKMILIVITLVTNTRSTGGAQSGAWTGAPKVVLI
jgi:hypothetical protein